MNKHWNLLKEKYKKNLALLTLDNLNESNRIIKFIGLVFVMIGGLLFSDKLIITDLVLTSIALSGIFFIATDFIEYFILEIDSKKAIPIADRYKNKRKYALCKVILLFLAILTLIIGPYLNLKPNTVFLDTLSNSLSLIAIGLTILKIGMDNSKKKQDHELQILNEINEAMRVVEAEEEKKST